MHILLSDVFPMQCIGRFFTVKSVPAIMLAVGHASLHDI